jgi:hypothetical protein
LQEVASLRTEGHLGHEDKAESCREDKQWERLRFSMIENVEISMITQIDGLVYEAFEGQAFGTDGIR